MERARAPQGYTWMLAAIMLAAYLGFILLIAFDKAFLARPIAGGVTSIGIVVGFGVPGYSLAIRGLYELHEAEVKKNLKPGVRT